MKIVVIGGTGLIGSKTVAILRQGGHDVVAASPNTGVNTITGQGLKEAMAGSQAIIDLANSPSFEDRAVLEFFTTSEGNLLPAETAAGVHSQDFARSVPAHRGGRRCCYRRRCGARSATKRCGRDRRPGTSAVQRSRRPLSEGHRRPPCGRERPRGPILRRPGRGALAGAAGRGAPRPHRFRRMAPPLTGSGLIPYLPTGILHREKKRGGISKLKRR